LVPTGQGARERGSGRAKYYCGKYNAQIVLGKDNYFLSADGLLMPARKDQAQPDLKYFKQTAK
jgi:hypothetical protein